MATMTLLKKKTTPIQTVNLAASQSLVGPAGLELATYGFKVQEMYFHSLSPLCAETAFS